jgi:hypothetical protein
MTAACAEFYPVAREWAQQGFLALPKSIGGKRPACRWRHFQQRPPSDDCLLSLFDRDEIDGLGVLLRPGQTVLDVDGTDLDGLGALPATLTAMTPRGGYHLHFDAGDLAVPYRLDVTPNAHLLGARHFTVIPPTPGYRWTRDGTIARLPDHLAALVLTKTATQPRPRRSPRPRQGTLLLPDAAWAAYAAVIPDLRVTGTVANGTCPLHPDEHPSLAVWPDHRGRLLWRCQADSCTAGGGTIGDLRLALWQRKSSSEQAAVYAETRATVATIADRRARRIALAAVAVAETYGLSPWQPLRCSYRLLADHGGQQYRPACRDALEALAAEGAAVTIGRPSRQERRGATMIDLSRLLGGDRR